MLFSSRVRVRIRLSVWLVCGYAQVFIVISVVTVPYPRLIHSMRHVSVKRSVAK